MPSSGARNGNFTIITNIAATRAYGHDEFHLHFHNLMEIGICRQGLGDIYMDEEVLRYKAGDITLIPENYPHITISDGEGTNYWEYIFFDLKSVVEELFPDNPVFLTEVVASVTKRAVMTNSIEEIGRASCRERV